MIELFPKREEAGFSPNMNHLATPMHDVIDTIKIELSTGRMDPRVGSGRVGSGRVTILPDFGGSGRVSTSDLFSFLLIISRYLNRYESSNTRLHWD